MQSKMMVNLDSSIHIEPTNFINMVKSTDVAMGHIPRVQQLLPKAPIICDMLSKIL